MGGLFHVRSQAAVAVGALVALGLALAILFGRPAPAAGQPAPASQPAAPLAAVEPAPRPLAAPTQARRRPRPPGFLVVAPGRSGEVVVRSRPGGGVVARLGGRTEFGSRTTLAVVRRRGRWLAVVTTHLPNGRLGWVDPRENPLRYRRTLMSLVLDLSARRLVLKRGSRAVRRMTVGVGRPSSPTPLGRFAVTDELSGGAYGAYYGCCILALSAHQPNLPSGWRGGDRVAIHGTNDPASIGAASSAGCPHARDADLRALSRLVPLGTPVFVHA
jgi:L,D-transpeptidase-like protein